MKETQQEPTRSSSQADPLRLAGVTVRAVDQIGKAASDEIQRAADELGRSANETIDEIRKLADSIRSYTKATSDRVFDFCDKTTSIVEGVRELHDKLRAGERPLQKEGIAENELSLAKVARKAPGNGHSRLLTGYPAE